MALAEQAERAYEQLVKQWREKPAGQAYGRRTCGRRIVTGRPGGARSRRPAVRQAVAGARKR